MPEELAPATGEEQTEVTTPEQESAPSGDTQSADELRAEIARLKREKNEAVRESIGRKTKLQELEAAKQAAEDAEKSELQKAQDELQRLTSELKASQEVAFRHTVLSAIRSEGQKLKVLLNEDALSDLYAAGHFSNVETDDNGKPIGVDSFLKDLIKAKPYILQAKTEASENYATRGSDKASEFDEIRKKGEEKLKAKSGAKNWMEQAGVR